MAVAFFGDGAVNNGAFHEGLNMAGIWKLPVLFVCENNQYATEVPFAYAAGNPSVANRGASYGMPGVDLDGNDVLAVYQAAGEAVRRARSGDGPDACSNAGPTAPGRTPKAWATTPTARATRSKPGKPAARSLRFRARSSNEGRSAIDRARGHRAEIDAIVDDALQFAESSPWPEPETAVRFVFDESNGRRDRVLGPDRGAAKSARLVSRYRPARSLTCRPPSKPWPKKWPGTRRSSSWAKGIGKRGGNFKTTTGLYDLYGPVRLCDTPICERGFVGLGCGAAMTGTRPVVDFMFADFILDSVGEIINQIAKIQYMSNGRLTMPILLRGCIGIGHSAATHHSGNYYPMYAHFPGLRVVVPSTPYDAKGLMKKALRCNDPVDLPGTPRAAERQGPGSSRTTTRSTSARPPSSVKAATSRSSPWR